ncbi:MAG: hypothetical protein QF805_28420 [Pirellulaceae bacterium]|nr:hypothetical protein [Pirellulaceae bacterium]
MRDVALKDGGMLVGAVLNPAGKPQANVAVHCISGGKVVATAKSDDRGRFAFNQLRGGVLQLQSSESVALVRVWAPRTAPPNAQQGVMLVHGGELVRGQEGALLNMFSNPYFLGGLAAVAIAAPLAIAAGS